jgi:uncharacterized protein YndB with AHSA1/START domain
MGKEFEIEHEIEVDASPEQVWDAISTGAGIDSWFMGRTEVTPGLGGSVRTVFGDYRPQHTITAWQPGERLAFGSADPDGQRIGFELLIEGRAGGSTVVRMVTSGFLPGDDWDDEYDSMSKGLQMFLRTLREYLTHFPGRAAVPITADGPPTSEWRRDFAAVHEALGLKVPAQAGDRVDVELGGVPPIHGVVYFSNADTVGIRTDDAMYRFLGGTVGPLNASHHVFADITAERANAAWTAWLREVTSCAS